MGVPIPPTPKEIIWNQAGRIMSVNYLAMSDYYNQLFAVFRSLMVIMEDEKNYEKLNAMIKEIEEWLSDDLNPMTLPEAEMRMFQNMDLLSGFQVNGQMITQLEIYDKLNKIKSWLQDIYYNYAVKIRFTVQIRMM